MDMMKPPLSLSSSERGREMERVGDFVSQQVPDWDDDVLALARFKALTGHRSDWEPRYLFWRDLILEVAPQLGLFILQSSPVKANLVCAERVKPFCIDHVLLEMYRNGDVLHLGDLYKTGKRLGHLLARFSRSASLGPLEEKLVLKLLLQEKADAVIRVLCENQWNSTCIITLEKFRSNCGEPDEAAAILNYLSGAGKATYFSSYGNYCIEKQIGMRRGKIISCTKSVLTISALDRDSMHLVWTMDSLEQKLRAVDERSKSSALRCLKYGNKQAALRFVRQMKTISQSRGQCTALLNRVEEVHNAMVDAEATKEVAEAIRIGAQAMKEKSICWDY